MDRIVRLLITGATGFVGSNILRHFSAQGADVAVIVRDHSNTSKIDSEVPHFIYNGSYESIAHAVDSFAPTVVVHAASKVLRTHKAQDIRALLEANILFGTHMLEAMAQAKVKTLINFGTSWQHYHSEAYKPVCLYAATKQAFESMISYYCDAEGLGCITLMLSDTYGPNDPRDKLLQLLLNSWKTGEKLWLSPGDQITNFLHVRDLCNAVEVAIDRSLLSPGHQEQFSVRGSELLSLKSFVALIEEIIGNPLNIKLGGKPYRPREVMKPWMGEMLPNWRQKIGLREGLEEIFHDPNRT
jgi:nucleoside-diphosphate-sugar epimerase